MAHQHLLLLIVLSSCIVGGAFGNGQVLDVAASSSHYSDYTVEISVGTMPQKMRVILDTGSDHLMLAVDANTGAYEHFRPHASNTYRDLKRTITLHYGTGDLEAREFEDHVQLNGLRVSGIRMLGVKDENALFKQADGVLGLGFFHAAIAPNFVDQVVDMGAVPDNIFALQFCLEGRANLMIGEGSSEFHSAEVVYAPLVPESNIKPLEAWMVSGVEINVGKDTIHSQTAENIPFIVDSGTQAIFLPPPIHTALLDKLPAVNSDGSVCDIKWEDWPLVTIGLRSEPKDTILDLSLAAQHYLQATQDGCYQLVFQPSRPMAALGFEIMNVLGIPLLNAFYAEFDKENLRVGFAPIAGCDKDDQQPPSPPPPSPNDTPAPPPPPAPYHSPPPSPHDIQKFLADGRKSAKQQMAATPKQGKSHKKAKRGIEDDERGGGDRLQNAREFPGEDKKPPFPKQKDSLHKLAGPEASSLGLDQIISVAVLLCVIAVAAIFYRRRRARENEQDMAFGTRRPLIERAMGVADAIDRDYAGL